MENITQLAWIFVYATASEIGNLSLSSIDSTITVVPTAWAVNSTIAETTALKYNSPVAEPTFVTINSTVTVPTSSTENSTVTEPTFLTVNSTVSVPTSLTVNSTAAVPTTLTVNSTVAVPMFAPGSRGILMLVSKVFYAGVIPLLVLVGIALNVLSIFVINASDRKSSTTAYLLNLTVSDILVNVCSLITCFFVSMQQFKITAISTMTDIKSLSYFFNLPSASGNLITTAVSLERFAAIVFPIKIRQLHTRTISIATVIFVYLYVLSINIPTIVINYLRSNLSSENSQSDLYDRLMGIFYLCNTFGLRIIPVFAVTFLSLASILALLVNRKVLNKGLKRPTLDKREMKVTKTLLVFTLTFVLCQLPGTVLRLNTVTASDKSDLSIATNSGLFTIIRLLSFLLFNVNSCVNFFIYIGTSKEYRLQFKKLKCRSIHWPRLRSQNTITSITSNRSEPATSEGHVPP